MASQRVGAALLGCGLFAKDVYAKLLRSTLEQEVKVVSVWSRSQESATAFVQGYFEGSVTTAESGEAGLERIFSNPAVHLVIVVLPVQSTRQVVQRALRAGKSVVQEKPVAGTAALALEAIHAYRCDGYHGGGGGGSDKALSANRSSNSAPTAALPPAPLWLVAENYRYEAVFLEACKVAPRLGKVIKMDLVADLPMDARNKYHASAWRRDTSLCPGGFLMDSSVHFVAALRLLAGAAGMGEAVSTSAYGRQVKPDLSDPDSIVGVVRFASGAPASVSISLASHTVKWSLTLVGTDGSLEVSRGGWSGSRGEYTLTWQCVGEAQPSSAKHGFSGVQTEFSEFVSLVRQRHNSSTGTDADASSTSSDGEPSSAAAAAGAPGAVAGVSSVASALVRGSPEEGARDLALLEAMFASSAAGGASVPVLTVP